MAQNKISESEMRIAIERSGYLLEQRAKTTLERAGFGVEMNSSYSDPRTDVSREFDIWAVRSMQAIPGGLEHVAAVIIAECENNSQPVVFFESKFPDHLVRRFYEEVRCSGLPVKIWRSEKYQSLPSYLGFSEFHHYSRGPFATQYCTFSRPKGNPPKGDPPKEWIAQHTDEQHKSLDTIANALDASVDFHFAMIKPPDPNGGPIPSVRIYYPLLVLQGDMYLARQHRQGVKLRKVNHIQYRREICRDSRPIDYQIDVVRESHLARYLILVNKELARIAEFIAASAAEVRQSQTRIIRDYTENRTNKPAWPCVLKFHE